MSFVTNISSIRDAVAAHVGGEPVLFISGLTGDVGCYGIDGRQLWVNPSATPAVMFDIEAADIDGDGQDELLTASADGHITCWGGDGRLRWRFNPGHKVRFSQVAVLRSGRDSRILAAGNDFTLYELNSDGRLVSTTPIEGVVRTIQVGRFVDKDRQSIFLMTLAHDKFRWDFMGFLDSETKQVLSSLDSADPLPALTGRLMVTDLDVTDLSGDGRDAVLFFGVSGQARFGAINGEFQEVASFTGPVEHQQRYSHTRGACLLPVRPEIVMQFGGVTYVCDLQGNLLHTTGERHRGLIYNDLELEPESGQLMAAGQVGGGNSIYPYPLHIRDDWKRQHALDVEGWWQRKHVLRGRLAEVEQNLAILYQQTLNFTPPAYQKPAAKPWVMITPIGRTPEVEALQGNEIIFVQQYLWHEGFDRSELVKAVGEIALKKDRRGKYQTRREEIIAQVRRFEAEGTPFAAWAGHGNDPWYLSIDTLEAILETAPTTCYGFVYAEMSNPEDQRYHHFINHDMPRLAKACRQNGKARLYFRYKNVFWAATGHSQPWRKLFFEGRYDDIMVPSAEDTNSRMQEINFAGRIGMLAAGYVQDVAIRLVDDNPTSWRPHSPGGQRTASPYLRSGVMLAAYGARTGILFDNRYLEDPGINILFALMKSGVLPQVDPEDILSIGSWHLIRDLDEELVHHNIESGHNLKLYKPDDEDAVLSVGAIHWSGTNLPEHDFSRKALGVNYRWLHFMPELPHGMVPIAPVEHASALDKEGVPYSVSDCRAGYVDGEKVPAREFATTLALTLAEGDKRQPVLVSGVAWSAIRLDAGHTRLVLVDPGYIDPQEREATVTFQGSRPVSAVDVLTGESLRINGSELKLAVPAGSMRFIDLSYER